MPALFGRQPGPRQRPDRNQGYPSNVGSTTAAWVAVRAEPDALAELLPGGFALAEPLLVAEAITLNDLPWLAGRGYEMLMLTVPVSYTNTGIEYRGRLELVTWENCPDAIISGRDELGFNKVYADQMSHTIDPETSAIHYAVAWDDTQFFEMTVLPDKVVPELASWRDGPLMHYRVLPRTGAWGEFEIEQITSSNAKPEISTLRSFTSGSGSIAFTPATFEQLPTLVHIVNTLAAIPLGDVVDAGTACTASWQDFENTQIIGPAPDSH